MTEIIGNTAGQATQQAVMSVSRARQNEEQVFEEQEDTSKMLADLWIGGGVRIVLLIFCYLGR